MIFLRFNFIFLFIFLNLSFSFNIFPRQIHKTHFLFKTFCSQEVNLDNNKKVESKITEQDILALKSKISELENLTNNIRNEIINEEIEIERLERQYGEDIKRIKKEFERIKLRASEETHNLNVKARIDALNEVLDIIDNYHRANAAFLPLNTESERNIYNFYEKVFSELTNVLHSFGLERIESVGKPFNYNTMEAVVTSQSDKYPEGIVCDEIRSGYMIENKCVRPAMVIVSSGPKDK